MVNADQQLTISNLFFVTLGCAISAAVLPYLYANSGMSPPWSVLVLLILMFSWCMIPLRAGATRVWWVGFFGAGSACLAIGVMWNVDDRIAEMRLGVGEGLVVKVTLFATIFVTILAGAVGGFVLRHVYSLIGYFAINVSENRSQI